MKQEVRRLSNLRLEDASLMFRPNFSGENRFGYADDRNFTVRLEKGLAEALDKDGWPVKWTKVTDDNPDSVPYMKVKVKYENTPYPPVIKRLCGNTLTLLNEDTISQLDSDTILSIDAEIRAYYYGDKVQTVTGRVFSAYAVKMVVKVQEDWLDQKYSYLSADDDPVPFE